MRPTGRSSRPAGRLVNADCILIGEQPRIAPQREEMRRRLSEALGGGEVNVRATTTDHLGFTGRGEGLAAHAVALLERAWHGEPRVETPIGTLGLVGSDAGLRYVRWSTSGLDLDGGCSVLDDAAAQLDAYFAGDLIVFDLPLDLGGTEFQRRCWLALATIPVRADGELRRTGARLELGPDSARAVGAANGQNPLPLVLPCHRVIGPTAR